MIDVLRDETFSLQEAAKRLPRLRRGRPVHVATLWRWARAGIRGIKLETAKVGGATVTSAAALTRFFAALADLRQEPALTPQVLEQEHVERQLASYGI